jgi:hypothetical protein
MPRIRIGQQASGGTLQQTITDRIKAGKVVPILSQTACNDLALGQGQHQQMIQGYAQHDRYDPSYLAGGLKLPQIAQYVSIVREQVPDPVAAKELYLKFAKSWLFELAETERIPQAIMEELEEQFDAISFIKLAERLGYPGFERGPEDPLLILADFSLPLYLTTSPHAFLEMALKRAGKSPRTTLCGWREGLELRPFFYDERGQLVFEKQYHPSENQPLV